MLIRQPGQSRQLPGLGVDPGGIEPPPPQCECGILPLNYGPIENCLLIVLYYVDEETYCYW